MQLMNASYTEHRKKQTNKQTYKLNSEKKICKIESRIKMSLKHKLLQ